MSSVSRWRVLCTSKVSLPYLGTEWKESVVDNRFQSSLITEGFWNYRFKKIHYLSSRCWVYIIVVNRSVHCDLLMSINLAVININVRRLLTLDFGSGIWIRNWKAKKYVQLAVPLGVARWNRTTLKYFTSKHTQTHFVKNIYCTLLNKMQSTIHVFIIGADLHSVVWGNEDSF